MLRKLNDLIGFHIETPDGSAGTVHDFLLDHQWCARYCVVDTGPWLLGKRVLLSTEALGAADWEMERIPTTVSKESIQESPAVNPDQPLLRRHEALLHAHYGWAPYWMGMPGAVTGRQLAAPLAPTIPPAPAVPADIPLEQATAKETEAMLEQAKHDDRVARLSSARKLLGHHIQATDGEIGHVEDLFISETDWCVDYLLVDTRNWWPGKMVMVSRDRVRNVDNLEGLVQVEMTKEAIRAATEYDPKGYTHVGRNRDDTTLDPTEMPIYYLRF